MRLCGILRLRGSSSIIQEVMKQLEQKGEFLPTLAHHNDALAVAGAFKRFFREMKGRLIPNSFLEEYLQNQRGPADLPVMFSRLDPITFATAQFVFGFLIQITNLSEENKMTPKNVAITIGLSLVDLDDSDVTKIMSGLPLTEAILENYHNIFLSSECMLFSLIVSISSHAFFID